MASIVERLEGGLSRAAGRLLPSVRAQAAEAQAFRVAFRDKPWEFDAYNGLLSELDAETLAFLVDQLQYEEVLHLGGAGKPSSESDRMRKVERSRWQYRWDPLTRWVVRLWTYFGYGLNVDIVPDDEAAVPVWEEYWTAKRNRPVFGQRRLRYNSDVLLRDGELFFVNFVSEVTGEVTTRRLLTDEVTEIVRHPDDRDTVLFYKRAITNGPMAGKSLYYPDWTAEPDELDAWWEKAIGTATGAIRMDIAMPETGRAYTTCNVVAVQINLGTEGRGWPQMTSGLTWSSAYGKILQDRAAVVRKRAMYDSKVKVKGGQRALAYVQGRVQSSNVTQGGMERNPPASAGSDWLENEAVDRSPINMGNSGAQEAELDSTAIFGMATLAGGLFPHYAGKGEAFRLATASAMETPILRGFSDYQLTWADVFRDICQIVLEAAQEYGGKSFETIACDVNQDALVNMDPQAVQQAASAIAAIATTNAVPIDEMERAGNRVLVLALQSLGVGDADDVVNPPEEEGEGLPPVVERNLIGEAADRIIAGLEWEGNHAEA